MCERNSTATDDAEMPELLKQKVEGQQNAIESFREELDASEACADDAER